ncbi:UNVERIFIED_CONTAM: hypothetical protein GTU68_064296 [Idotea baltica]|nr:hypothetical protein [Idotea baltica]
MQPMLNIALRAARSAGELIFRSIERLDTASVEDKEALDYVTNVENMAEQLIVQALQKTYPEHSFLGKTGGLIEDRTKKSEYVWIINSLDGTINFLHGMPHFAISISCKHRNRLEHAIILDPIRQEEFTATRGRGASLNGHRLRVSKRKNLDGALLGSSLPFSVNQPEQFNQYFDMFRSLNDKKINIRQTGVTSLDLAYVAAGRYDAFCDRKLSEWDTLAGTLLIQEAGGLISDFQGGHSFLENGSVIASNPKCLKAILTTIQPFVSKK